MNSIAFIGDLTVDRYLGLRKTHLGGASLNGAIWAMRAGAKQVSIVSAVGNDKPGRLFLQKICAEHINEKGVSVLQGRTSSIEIFVDSKGERSWGKWDAGVLEQYHLGDHELTVLRSSQVVVVTVYDKTLHLLFPLSALEKENIKRPIVVVNFGDLSELGRSTKIVEDHLDDFDVAFFGLNSNSDSGYITKIKKIANNTGKLMVVTLGDHGAIAFRGRENYESPSEHVDPKTVIDTTGAGDAFLAAFTVTYLKTDGDIMASLSAGNHLSAKKIQMLGAY
jgi:fructoselysine 6-kinase